MQKELSTSTLNSIVGVTVLYKKKNAKEYIHNTDNFLYDGVELLLEDIKTFNPTSYVKAYYIIWQWHRKQTYYALIESVFDIKMLRKVDSRTFNVLPFVKLLIEALAYPTPTKGSVKAMLIALRYTYRLHGEIVSFSTLTRSEKIFIKS